MILYAKIANQETKECFVGLGTDIDFYKSIGMTEMDVIQAWDGSWYVAGYAPEKPQKVIILERIEELKVFLCNADYWGQKYIDGEYTDEEWEAKKAQRKAWREEIRELEAQIEPNGENSIADGC